MNQIAVGKFIMQKRKEKNLTQEQLAEKIGGSNKTVSKWETGKGSVVAVVRLPVQFCRLYALLHC